MAEKKYLSYNGLQDVAGHVNTRLKTVTTIPVSADDGAVRLYVGETGATYTKGHIYQYNSTDLEWVDITSEYTAGNGIDITDNEISVETYIFTGTQAQWDALTTDQKKEYDICNITDDASSDDEIYTKSEIDAMLGTAASKDYTDVVRPNDHDLVESNAVYAAINNALSSIYTPRGDLTCAELTSALLIEQNVGNVYQMTDSGTTSALFINGAGHTINVNDNVGIIKAGESTYLFNLMGNAFDLHDYQKKDLTSAVEGATTVESALGALSSNKQAKTLTTPLTIGGTSQTTVEDALGALNATETTDIQNIYKVNSILGAKNLCNITATSKTANGITFTIGNDGSITVNGTATTKATLTIFDYYDYTLKSGDYILSGIDEGSSSTINMQFNYYNNQGQELRVAIAEDGDVQGTIPTDYNGHSKLYLVVENGQTINKVVYPMIRFASDTDSTYQPYVLSNKALMDSDTDIYSVMGRNGAKNLLVYPYYNTTTTAGSFIFTDNRDGSVTVNGTTSGNAVWFWFLLNGDIKAGNYIYSNATALPENIQMSVINYTTPEVYLANIIAGEKTKSFSVNNDISGTIRVGLRVAPNATITNYVVKPMIRYASDTDDTYVPFAMTNQQITPYVQAISNPNLLDNPWFTINQRGFTTNTANGYTVDRWKKQTGDGTITKSSNGITIEPTTSGSMLLFRQQLDTDTMIPYILGKTVTLSVMLSNGTIYSATGTAPSTLTSSFQYLCYVQIDSVNRFVLQLKNGDCSVQYYNDGSVIPSTIITVKAIKLELGSVSTLAMDTAPNYQQELAKCQRYFVRYTGAGYPEICHAIESSGLNAWGLCFLPVPMKIKPSIAFANVNAYRLSDDSATAITAMEIHALANNACKIMFTLASNGINGAVAEIQPNSASNGYVDFSADL